LPSRFSAVAGINLMMGGSMRKCLTFAMSVAAIGVFVSGCSQAGPFITNVSSSGPNKLLIEKCHVQLNAVMWTVSNDQCTTHEITFQVQPNGGK